MFVSSELKVEFDIYFLVYLENTATGSNRFFDLLITLHDWRLTFSVIGKAKQVQTLSVYFSTKSLSYSVLFQLQEDAGFACLYLQQHEYVSHRVAKALETQSRCSINWSGLNYFGFAPVFLCSVENLSFCFLGFVFGTCGKSANSYRNLGDEIYNSRFPRL